MPMLEIGAARLLVLAKAQFTTASAKPKRFDPRYLALGGLHFGVIRSI